MDKKLLIVEVAALSRPPKLDGLAFAPIRSVFPALTCTVQASFRTASAPAAHGMIANGLFFRRLGRAMFWEQSAALVEGRRIWSEFRRRGGRVGMLFWQQSLGEDVDVLLSPAPIHKHHGGLIEDCYARPAGLYERLCRLVGRRFKLRHYWGPLASPAAGDWIAQATAAVMRDRQIAPELLLSYLPALDYDFQRWGPDDPRSGKALRALEAQLRLLVRAAGENGYEVLIFGDYAIAPVDGAVFANRALHQAGLLKTRRVGEMLYPDLHASDAFAMVDHEVAHVYVAESGGIGAAREVLASLDGVSEVLDRRAQAAVALDHANSGDLVIVAAEGKWFAYPWWTEKHEAPDYAGHVDIHNKPGFDPCELFARVLSWPPMSVQQNVARIRGSHWRAGQDRRTTWAGTLKLANEPADLVELAGAVREWLDQ